MNYFCCLKKKAGTYAGYCIDQPVQTLSCPTEVSTGKVTCRPTNLHFSHGYQIVPVRVSRVFYFMLIVVYSYTEQS